MAGTANSVITSQSLKTAQCVSTTAKTTYNDSTGAVLLMTAGADGAVVYSVKAVPRASVTATHCQLYRSHDSGTTLYYINGATMGAQSLSNTAAFTVTDFGYTESIPLRLAANERLYVGIGVTLSGGVVFDAQYEDL